MSIDATLVYGERISDLVPLLLAVRDSARINADGNVVFSVELPPPAGTAAVAALMRVES